MGVSPSFVSQVENGKSQPSVATLYSFAQLFDVSIDQLFVSDEAGSAGLAAPVIEAVPVSKKSRPSVVVIDGTDESDEAPVRRANIGNPADAWPQANERARISFMRSGSRPRIVMDSGVIWEQLATNTGSDLDFIEVVYPPHSSSTNDQRMLRHVGFEYGYLIEGELEMQVGFETFTLHAGESMGFDSATPHLFRNHSDTPARGIWCIHHPRP
jgi:transcriptional regulator with XRE-family HTH domain/mannose-6-phosphate isomerase-like protein (cupin superfamily)